MSFENNIKNYIKLDNEIRELNNKIKNLKEEKNIYNKKIIDYVNSNNLEKATIKICDSKLKFINIQHCQPLTYKYLETCFHKFFKNNVQLSQQLLQFIKNERDIKYIKEIKRTYE